jgi:hypothetical protein
MWSANAARPERGEDLLTSTAVAPAQSVTLKPWDLVIVEEK